jgi:carbonic anhydrase/acetyltransferase-like protein (isoleucine patch superfamily)
MTIYALGDLVPRIHEDTWVAADANLIGRVVMDSGSSIWFGSTLRAEHEDIHIGEGSNIQENCVLHVDPGFPLTIGKNCTIGHKVMLHGCTIDDNTLVGIGAIILNGARIGKNCLVGAGALVTEGKQIPDNSLVMGAPGKVVRQIGDEHAERIALGSKHYQDNMRRFRAEMKEVR